MQLYKKTPVILIALAFIRVTTARRIQLTTQNVFSARTNSLVSIITSGSEFPSIALECQSLDGLVTQTAIPEIRGPVSTETDIEDLQPGKYIAFGVCDLNSGEGWKVVPTCWLVEQVAVCGNSKGIFCGSVDTFGGLGVRLIDIPDGDGITISTGGTMTLTSDFDGYCHTAIANDDLTVALSPEGVEIVAPKYTEPNWVITFRDEGSDLPGCAACEEGCDPGLSQIDACAAPTPLTTPAPSIDVTNIESTFDPSSNMTYVWTAAPSDI